MKTSVFALAALSLGSLVAAAPLKAKRGDDVVWVTQVDVVTQVIESTVTVWVDALPTPAPAPAPVSSAQNGGEFFEKSKSVVPAAPATTFATSTSSSTSSTPAPSSTPAAVVPSPQAPAPVQTTPVVVAAPATTAAPAPPAATTTAASNSGSSSGGATGSVYSGGDITYYDPNGGYGSCGTIIQNSDDVVALPFGMMDAVSTKSNGHPWCGKKVAIYYGGQTYYATAQDKCMGCKTSDIDMTSGLFKKICGDSVDGRGKGLAKWAFVE